MHAADDAVYLDNAATTPVCPAAAEAFAAALGDFGNPSSLHEAGFRAERLLARARAVIAGSLGADPAALVFTPSGTAADNLALFGTAGKRRRPGHIVSSALEHKAVSEPLRVLEARGHTVTYVPPQADGTVAVGDMLAAVRDDTFLVTCVLRSNELGTEQPVRDIAAAVKRVRPDILIHTDAVQAYCKQPLDMHALGVDLLAVSGHKVHAPKGIGALAVRRGVKLAPLLYGGGQENGLWPGTEATAQAAAFAAAVGAFPDFSEADTLRIHALRRIEAACPHVRCVFPGSGGICLLSLPGLRGETVMHFLAERGVYISTGSACSRGKPSPVLAMLPLDRAVRDGVIRVSFSVQNTKQDVERLVQGLCAAASLAGTAH